MKIFILLTHQPSGSRHKIGIGAPRVDIQTAAAGIAGVHAELFWPAETLNIVKDTLHALLVKLVVMSERHQVTQQLFPVNFRAAILNLNGAPVRLVGDKAVGFQQMADQRLFHDLSARRVFEVVGAEFVALYLNILVVDAGAVEMGDGLPLQFMQTV